MRCHQADGRDLAATAVKFSLVSDEAREANPALNLAR